jgi:hypothetical protein
LKIIFLPREIVEVYFHGGTITINWSHSYIYIYITGENRRFLVKAGKNRQQWVGTIDDDHHHHQGWGRLGKR